MAKAQIRTGKSPRTVGTTKYDAHHKVLSQTYGAFADLRRELSDSKAAVGEREEILRNFTACADSQRAWLLLEDYFERLSLSRKDFPAPDWWPRLLAVRGNARMEELAFLFLRAHRPVPTELALHANLRRFAEVEEAEQEQRLVRELENWLFPTKPAHLDSPRASLRVVCRPEPDAEFPVRRRLAVQFHLMRPRTGAKVRTLREVIELTTRASHEQELFSPDDWEFVQWLAETHHNRQDGDDTLILSNTELLHWLTRWGGTARLELAGAQKAIQFHGEVAELRPHLEARERDLTFTHRLVLDQGRAFPIQSIHFFATQPPLALAEETFYLLRNAPPDSVLTHWQDKPDVPVRKLSHRLLMHLRRTQSNHGVDWDQLVVAHSATPQFVFELVDESVRLRLLARSKRDESVWLWNGHEWQPNDARRRSPEKPEILDDPRLEAATSWLRQLDWFTPEPGLWVGDANENFLGTLANAWPIVPARQNIWATPVFSGCSSRRASCARA